MNNTLILSPRFSSDSQDMWNAAIRNKWEVHRAIRYTRPTDINQCCVYGELSFCDIMADRCGLALLDPPDNFLTVLTYRYVKRDIIFTEAKQVKNFNSKFFFKPANDKVFHRGVYERGSDVPLRYVDPECPVIISDVVDFCTETRLYCLDKDVKTAANYIFIDGENKDEEKELSEATEFGLSVLRDYGYYLPSAVVLDVGRLSGTGEWAVIEANQAYASGIYTGANTSNILDVIYRSSGPSDLVLERDRNFIRKLYDY